ncbi:MAG: hypothetical protein ACT4P2_13710 [Pseudomonadota bacterium]
MPGPYQQFTTDPVLETEGIVLDYGDFKITIARAGGANRKFGKALDAKLKPHRRQIELGTLDDKLATRLMAEAYAEAVVRGWSGMTDADGHPLPFSRENAVQLLSDLPDLFRDVQEQASRIALFRRQSLEDSEKNSATASGTS